MVTRRLDIFCRMLLRRSGLRPIDLAFTQKHFLHTCRVLAQYVSLGKTN